MRRYLFILMLSLGLISVPAAIAADPAMPVLGKWWKESTIVNQLRLTESQINQLEQSFLDHRLELAKLNSELKRCDADLRKLMQTDPIDEAAIRTQSEIVSKVRYALAKENSDMMLSMRKALTGEQWEQLEKIRNIGVAYTPGKDIVNPIPITMPAPHYTNVARDTRIEGIVVLTAIVRKDGTIDTFQILKGLGYGLDESAIQTVAKYWKFKPGTFKGQPVDVQVRLEISFRLF
jgi:TonB family protein